MGENSKPRQNAGPEPEDAPDLSQAPWREKVDAAVVRVGRPKVTSDVGRTLTLERPLS